MSFVKSPWLGLVAVALMALALPGTVQAQFVPGFAGNSTMIDLTPPPGPPPAPAVNGVVSFGVWSGGLTTLSTALGVAPVSIIGGGAPDLTAPYVYLYQIVNTAVGAPVLRELDVPQLAGSFTSGGYLVSAAGGSPTVFLEGVTPVNIANPGLGADVPVDDPAPDGSPSAVYGGPVGIAGSATAKTPLLMDLTSNPTSVSITWGNVPGFSAVIAPGEWSTIVYLTSHIAPVGYQRGDLHDTGSVGNGDLPTPAIVPEPTSIAMLGFGLFGAVAYRYRRRSSAHLGVSA